MGSFSFRLLRLASAFACCGWQLQYCWPAVALTPFELNSLPLHSTYQTFRLLCLQLPWGVPMSKSTVANILNMLSGFLQMQRIARHCPAGNLVIMVYSREEAFGEKHRAIHTRQSLPVLPSALKALRLQTRVACQVFNGGFWLPTRRAFGSNGQPQDGCFWLEGQLVLGLRHC